MKYLGLFLLFAFVASNPLSETEKEVEVKNEDGNGLSEQIQILYKNFHDGINRGEQANHKPNGTSNGAISNGIGDIWRMIKKFVRALAEDFFIVVRSMLTPQSEDRVVEIWKKYFNNMVAKIQVHAKVYMHRFIEEVKNGKVKEIKDVLIGIMNDLVQRVLDFIKWIIGNENENEIKVWKNRLKSIVDVLMQILQFITTVVWSIIKDWVDKVMTIVAKVLLVVSKYAEIAWEFVEDNLEMIFKTLDWFFHPAFHRIRKKIMPVLARLGNKFFMIYYHMLPPYVRWQIIDSVKSDRSQNLMVMGVTQFLNGWTTFLEHTNSVFLKAYYPISIEVANYIGDVIMDKQKMTIPTFYRYMRHKIFITFLNLMNGKVAQMFMETRRQVEPFLSAIDTIIPKKYMDILGDTMDKVADLCGVGLQKIMVIAVNEGALDIENNIKELIGEKHYNKYLSGFFGDSEHAINHDVRSIKSFIGEENLNFQDKSEPNFHSTLWERFVKILERAGSKLSSIVKGIYNVREKYRGVLGDLLGKLMSKGIYQGKVLLQQFLHDVMKAIIWGQ